jgi:hypothetical protein
MSASDEASRRAARASWPIRVYRLGEEPDDDLSSETTDSDRLDMMWRLALDAWASAGRSLPEYSRAEMPGRILRGADGADAGVE